MFSLEQLRGFVAVAEHLHFGRAAESLQMTQPPLSRQIQKLEADLGALLFDRSNRSVVLTPVGEILLDRAHQILALTESSRSVVQSAARGSEGSLAVGFTAASALSVLGPLLSRFAEEMPRVQIDLRERVTNVQLAEIERGTIDLGLVRAPHRDDSLDSTEVLVEPLVAVFPSGHPLAAKDAVVTLDELVAYPFIGYARHESEYFYRKTQSLFGERPLNIAYQVSQILSLMSLVGMGLGFGLVPESAKRMQVDGVEFRGLELSPNEQSLARVSIHAVWPKQSPNPALWRAVAALRKSGLNSH